MATGSSFVKTVVRSFATKDPGPDFILDFVIFFARFEYALKRAGYFRGDHKQAEANWDCFAVRLRTKFDSTVSPAFDESVAQILANPPKKQIVLDGKVTLAETKQGDGEGKADYVLPLVRVVRNNLFHGGKFPEPSGPMAETSRDRGLLQNCLTILSECANMDPDVGRWFELDV